MCNIWDKQPKTAIRIKNCIDNHKNLIVLKMMQFGTLMTSLWHHYDAIIWLHHIITIVNIFSSYNNHIYICIYIYHITFILWHLKLNNKSRKIENFQNFLIFTVLGCPNKILITTSKRDKTLSKLSWKLKFRKS